MNEPNLLTSHLKWKIKEKLCSFLIGISIVDLDTKLSFSQLARY